MEIRCDTKRTRIVTSQSVPPQSVGFQSHKVGIWVMRLAHVVEFSSGLPCDLFKMITQVQGRVVGEWLRTRVYGHFLQNLVNSNEFLHCISLVFIEFLCYDKC